MRLFLAVLVALSLPSVSFAQDPAPETPVPEPEQAPSAESDTPSEESDAESVAELDADSDAAPVVESDAVAESATESVAESVPPVPEASQNLCLCPCPTAQIAPEVAEAVPADIAPEVPPEPAPPEIAAPVVARDVPRGTACMSEPISFVRVWGERRMETARVRLTTCDGDPWPEGVDQLSVLARPLDVDRPTRAQMRRFARSAAQGRGDPAFVIDGVRRLDSGLATRLQAIANQFPDKRIVIVSGFRPNARSTSRHRHGRALDIRVEDVTKEDVVEFARTLPETGVGYYPNSVLTHVDVRDRRAYWVDRSAPGESADYGRWPAQDEDLTPQELLSRSLDALDRIAEQDEDAVTDDGARAEPEGDTEEAPVEAAPAEPERDATRDALIRRILEGANALAPADEGETPSEVILE